MVEAALGSVDAGVCATGGVGDDGTITIDEVIRAINEGLTRCVP